MKNLSGSRLFLCPKSTPLCQKSDLRQPQAKSAGLKEGGVTLFIGGLIFLCATNVCAETGTASYYTRASCIAESGQCRMANGKELNDGDFTVACWEYPFGTRLKVSSLETKKSVYVVVTDRGPAKSLVKQGRIVDLSKAAFSRLADLKKGVIKVEVEKQ